MRTYKFERALLKEKAIKSLLHWGGGRNPMWGPLVISHYIMLFDSPLALIAMRFLS